MSTKFQNSEEIRKAFQDLLEFNSIDEELEHRARMIMYRVLSEVEILSENRKMTRKELAKKIGLSGSYLTQLYRGNKPLNFLTIAKFEKALGITFDIKALSESDSENQPGFPNHLDISPIPFPEPEGFWYYKKFNKPNQGLGIPCLQEDTKIVSSDKSAA